MKPLHALVLLTTAAHADPKKCGPAPAPVEVCQAYNVELMGNPTSQQPLRDAYVAKLGKDVCYVTATSSNVFVCNSKDEQAACAAEQLVPDVAKASAWKQKSCEKGDGFVRFNTTEGQSVLLSKDKAKPRSMTTVDNGATFQEGGPYRNASDRGEPGQPFTAAQEKKFLAMNKAAHGGKLVSDLAGFDGETKANLAETGCGDTAAVVVMIFPIADQNGCAWGANVSANAMIVSRAYAAKLKAPTNELLAALPAPYKP